MKKFVFIGAGSLDFTRKLIRDLMTFPAFDDCEIALVDIDEKRLSYAKKGAEKIIQAGGHHAVVTATTERREALPGADGVLAGEPGRGVAAADGAARLQRHQPVARRDHAPELGRGGQVRVHTLQALNPVHSQVGNNPLNIILLLVVLYTPISFT